MSSVDSENTGTMTWTGVCRCQASRRLRVRRRRESAPPDDDLSRRRWLQLMGASLALAGVGRLPLGEDRTAAVCQAAARPNARQGRERFATAMELGGSALGLMVTCVDGRPIKIEGNPKHPYSLGATNAYAQAAILELYDPDRSE